MTVYTDDDEAAKLWHDHGGRAGGAGSSAAGWRTTTGTWACPGPAGPCSEIYYDRGPEYGREGGPVADEDRYLEVWNLVFMQEQLSAVRAKVDFDVAGELPSRNIDTGMGLERMAALLQGVDNIYEIDTMWKVLDRAAELTEQRYGRDHRTDVALRVVTDHVRTAVMLVADGVVPSNEARGYVLRRILRRSIRNLRLLAGAQRGGSAARGGRTSATCTSWPPWRSTRSATSTRSCAATRRTSTRSSTPRRPPSSARCAPAARSSTPRSRRPSAAGGDTIRGDQAFQLHDTYGFPIDLTLEMAAEQGLSVDEPEFRRLMAQQRQRAKEDAAGEEDRQRRHLGARVAARALRAGRRSPGTTR